MMGDVALGEPRRGMDAVSAVVAAEDDDDMLLGESSSESSSSSSSITVDEEEEEDRVHVDSSSTKLHRQLGNNDEDLCGFRLFKRPSSLLVNVDGSLSLSADDRSRQACLAWDNKNDLPNSSSSSSRTRRSDDATTNNSRYAATTLCPHVPVAPSLTTSSSFSWLSSFRLAEHDETALYTVDELDLDDDDDDDLVRRRASPATDLRRARSVWIVTTAALPWMTGTAVNPALRAAYLYQRYAAAAAAQEEEEEEEIFYETVSALSDDGDDLFLGGAPAATLDPSRANGTGSSSSPCSCWKITLVIPWLEREEDRIELYGADWADKTSTDQEAYIRQWLREKANQPAAADAIGIVWYRGRYYKPYRSIFPTEDICEVMLRQVSTEPVLSTTTSNNDAEETPKPVCILEEPEHLLLYRAMTAGTIPRTEKHPLSNKFYTLGVIHTNYRDYAAQGALGLVTKKVCEALCAVVTQAYTDKIVKLSGTLQSYAPHKETICNVHGIRADFLQVAPPTGNDIYFLGKLLWAKGLDKLLLYEKLYYRQTGQYFAIDIYGSGPDQDEIKKAFWAPRGGRRRRTIPTTFPGRVDHAAIASRYKIFCNPSVTEVLCTTSAEALAMNKFVVLPEHPSNAFFEQFPNALLYRTHEDFLSLLLYAQSHDPVPLTDDLRYCLSWEAATERLIEAAAISPREAARQSRLVTHDMKCYEFHAGISGARLGKSLLKSFFGPLEDEVPDDRT